MSQKKLMVQFSACGMAQPSHTSAAYTACGIVGALAPASVTTPGEIEQIQYLLGHESVQTTERYIGCKQRLRNASTIASG